MHEVAIITIVGDGEWSDYQDDFEMVVRSITNWEVVDDETFNLLQSAARFQPVIPEQKKTKFIVLERLETSSAPIVNSVNHYLNLMKKLKQEEEMRKAEKQQRSEAKKRAAEQRKIDAALHATLQNEQSRKVLYEQLKTEFVTIQESVTKNDN